MHRLRKFFGGSTALFGAIIVPWQLATIYHLLTGRIDAGFHYPPLGFSISVLVFGLIMLVCGYWASRDS